MEPIFNVQRNIIIGLASLVNPLSLGLSNRESSLRHLRDKINGDEKIIGMTTYNLSSHITNYLTNELNKRVINLVQIYNSLYMLYPKLDRPDYFMSFDNESKNLLEFILLSKLIRHQDVLKLTKKDTLVNGSVEYDIYENTLNTLLCLYLSLDKGSFLTKINNLIGMFLGDDTDILSDLYCIHKNISMKVKHYNRVGYGKTDYETMAVVRELSHSIKSENNKSINPDIYAKWVDWLFNNHEGQEHIKETMYFVLSLVKYDLNKESYL